MLCVNRYGQEYIDDCRTKVNSLLTAYKKLVSAADHQGGSKQSLKDAFELFEPNFFNNMVLALDNYFCHRSRTLELKDGNPLNEVRMLSNSIMNNDSKLTADKTIKYDPGKSVLKYKLEDEIKLKEADFSRLSEAFFADLVRKFS